MLLDILDIMIFENGKQINFLVFIGILSQASGISVPINLLLIDMCALKYFYKGY